MDRLRTLSTMGLVLGKKIEVLTMNEAGECTIRIGSVEQRLDAELAAGIRIEPTPTESARDVDPDKG